MQALLFTIALLFACITELLADLFVCKDCCFRANPWQALHCLTYASGILHTPSANVCLAVPLPCQIDLEVCNADFIAQFVQVTASQASKLTANQAQKSVGSTVAADEQATTIGRANALSRAHGDNVSGSSRTDTGFKHAQGDINSKNQAASYGA